MERLWIAAPFIAFGLGLHVFKSPWIALTLYHVLIISALISHRSKIDVLELFRGFSWSWLLLHLFGCFLLGWTLIQVATAKQFSPGVGQGLGTVGHGFVLYFLIINPALEELFWRGLLARDKRCLTFEDCAFGLFHTVILYPLISPAYIAAFVCGLIAIAWLWRQIKLKKDGLAIPFLGHFLGDLMFVLIVALLKFS